MKVKEIIEHLSKFRDQEAEAVFRDEDGKLHKLSYLFSFQNPIYLLEIWEVEVNPNEL